MVWRIVLTPGIFRLREHGIRRMHEQRAQLVPEFTAENEQVLDQEAVIIGDPREAKSEALLRAYRMFDVAVDSEGNPLKIPDYLLEAEKADVRSKT